MNISIFASVGCQNLGDELIIKNEVKLLEQEFGKDSKFRIFTYDIKNPFFTQGNIGYREYFPIGFKNIKNIVKNIQNLLNFLGSIIWSDIVVIGGGGIIYDSELQSVRNPLNQWVFRTQIARFFRKKIYFYGVGIDIKQEENYKKLKKIFKKAGKVTVRDEKSCQQLEKIGIQSKIIDDPVMSEDNNKGRILGTYTSQNFNIQDLKEYDFSGKRVGFALRSGYIGKTGDVRIEKLLIEELCMYIESQGGTIKFVPHSLHKTDIQANDYEFMKQFLNPDREIYVDMGEVYTIYNHKMLDIIITMRLHSIILSYVYGIDQIALSYSQKTDEVIKKLKN